MKVRFNIEKNNKHIILKVKNAELLLDKEPQTAKDFYHLAKTLYLFDDDRYYKVKIKNIARPHEKSFEIALYLLVIAESKCDDKTDKAEKIAIGHAKTVLERIVTELKKFKREAGYLVIHSPAKKIIHELISVGIQFENAVNAFQLEQIHELMALEIKIKRNLFAALEQVLVQYSYKSSDGDKIGFIISAEPNHFCLEDVPEPFRIPSAYKQVAFNYYLARAFAFSETMVCEYFEVADKPTDKLSNLQTALVLFQDIAKLDLVQASYAMPITYEMFSEISQFREKLENEINFVKQLITELQRKQSDANQLTEVKQIAPQAILATFRLQGSDKLVRLTLSKPLTDVVCYGELIKSIVTGSTSNTNISFKLMDEMSEMDIQSLVMTLCSIVMDTYKKYTVFAGDYSCQLSFPFAKSSTRDLSLKLGNAHFVSKFERQNALDPDETIFFETQQFFNAAKRKLAELEKVSVSLSTQTQAKLTNHQHALANLSVVPQVTAQRQRDLSFEEAVVVVSSKSNLDLSCF